MGNAAKKKNLEKKIIRKHYPRESPFNILFFGTIGQGKSALNVQFFNGVFVQKYDSSIEDAYYKNIEIDKNQIQLLLVDVNSSSSTLFKEYSKDIHLALLIYALNSRTGFLALESYLDEYAKAKYENEKNEKTFEQLSETEKINFKRKLAIVVVENKHDIEKERTVHLKEGILFARKYRADFVQVSAKTSHNLHDMFLRNIGMVINTDDFQVFAEGSFDWKKEDHICFSDKDQKFVLNVLLCFHRIKKKSKFKLPKLPRPIVEIIISNCFD